MYKTNRELLATSTLATWLFIEKRVDALLDNKKGKPKTSLREFYNGDTVNMTCFLTSLFEIHFPTVAKSYGLNVTGTHGQQKDYDFRINRKKVELKTTASEDLSSFTGSSGQSKDGADHFMLQRYKWHETRNIPIELGLWWTASFDKMPLSAQHYRGNCDSANKAGNTSFASIKIAALEADKVIPIIGGKQSNRGYGKNLPLKWLRQELEQVDYDRIK